MDKYEYKVRAEEIKKLVASKQYAEAMKIADTIGLEQGQKCHDADNRQRYL